MLHVIAYIGLRLGLHVGVLRVLGFVILELVLGIGF